MSKEHEIIYALNEAKRLNESIYKCSECGFETEDEFEYCPECGSKLECVNKEVVTNEEDEEVMNMNVDTEVDSYINDYLYSCPVCGAYFTSTVEFTGNCWCPECGEEIEPDFEGEIEEVSYVTTEEDNLDDLDEVEIKVKGGKVVKFMKKLKKGFKRIGNKYVKMTSKEKMARKKAGKKMGKRGLGHRGKANLLRRKSMKKRAAKGLNDSMHLDESVVMELLNNVLGDVFEYFNEEYYGFEVEDIVDATFKDDVLTCKALIRYEDGKREEAEFKFDFYNDGIKVSETTDKFDIPEVEIEAEGEIDDDEIEIEEMSYTIRDHGRVISESYYIQ